MLKQWLANNFPFLGKFKRYFVALWDTGSPIRSTYSQHGEDKYIWEYLKKFDLQGSMFVDIGANHPTDISNTYLLYRHGNRGLVIEPNDELIGLFRRFRQHDNLLMIGCSDTAGVLMFNISKTPVISSFSTAREVNVYRSMYVPILPLDSIVQNMDFSFINFLSIDVEGLNFEVLKGAAKSIGRALLICIEFDEDEELELYRKFLGANYEVFGKYGCNVIFLNTSLLKMMKTKS